MKKTKIFLKKITAIVLLFAIILTTSCKKDKILASGNNSLNFKVDGVQQTYTNLKGFNDGFSYIRLKGSKTTDTTTNEFEFEFYVDSKIVLGNSYNHNNIYLLIKYFDAAGVMYTITGGEITYTDETTSHISGTFSGTVKNGSTTKTITDGNFELNL